MNTNSHCTECGAGIHPALVADAPGPLITDRQFVSGLQRMGVRVVHNGQNTVPELGLQGIHEFSGLSHMGFGNFRDVTHIFLRHTSPRGTLFYEYFEAGPSGSRYRALAFAQETSGRMPVDNQKESEPTGPEDARDA